MRGLALLTPVLSCVLALVAYFLGASLWVIAAAFFVAGPVVVVLLGLLLGGRTDDAGDDMQGSNRRS